MPTPILEIPINDEAFKSFLNLFNKYKSEVARLPEIWKGTNEEIIAQISSANTIVDVIDKQTRALLEQQDVLHKQTQEIEKQSKLEAKREKAETAARKAQDKADKQAIADTKKIATNIANATVNIVKWGALDFVVAGALDLWGIGAVAKNASDQLTAARGVNATIGQRQALMQTFQPIFDTANALENAAEAQTDVTKSIPYRILGLNPNATNPAELSVEAAVAAKQRLAGVPQQNQLLYARALGLDQIFSPDELRRIINTPLSFLEEEKGRYEKLQKTLDIPPKVAQEYTKLSQDLSIAGRDIEVYFANKLIALGPGLDDLIHEFEGFAKHLIDLIDWKNLGQDVKNFATKVEDFVEHIDWNRIKLDLEGMAIGMEKVLEFFHLIPEPKYAPGSPEDKAQKARDALFNTIIASGQFAAAAVTGGTSLNFPGGNPAGALGNVASDLTGNFGTWASALDKALTNLHVPFVYRNNPGNIRPVGVSSGFMSYRTLGEGIAALARQDIYKQDHYKARTLAEVIQDYTGKSSETIPYIKFMSGALGLDPNSSINLHDINTLSKFLSAQMRLETGKNIMSAATIEAILKGQGGNVSAIINANNKNSHPRVHNHKTTVVVTHHLAPGSNTTTSTALASQ